MKSGRTTFTLRPCSVTLPEVSGRTAEIEPTTIQNLSTFDLAVELSSIEDSIELRTSQGVLLAGVALDEPGEEALPESKRDDRLVDVDEDGEPGMSLLVDGWKVYTAMRIKMALEVGYFPMAPSKAMDSCPLNLPCMETMCRC